MVLLCDFFVYAAMVLITTQGIYKFKYFLDVIKANTRHNNLCFLCVRADKSRGCLITFSNYLLPCKATVL